MTAQRSTAQNYRYSKLPRSKNCAFCKIVPGNKQFVEENQTMKVLRNRFSYSIWDGQGVIDHLMIVPKRHANNIGELKAEESLDYLNLVSQYETNGYNLYTRTPKSSIKSISHHHTHLIKLDNKNKRIMFMLQWPIYIRLSR